MVFLHNALRQCVFFANVSCMINCFIPYTTIFLLELMCILYIQLFVFYDLYLWFIKPNTDESSVIICLEQLRKAWFAHLLVGSLIPWTFATTKILFLFWPRKFCYLNVTMFCKHLSPTLSTSLNPNFWGTVSKARSSTLDIKMIKSINLLKKKSLNRFLICKIYFSHIYQKRIQYGFRPFNFTLLAWKWGKRRKRVSN